MTTLYRHNKSRMCLMLPFERTFYSAAGFCRIMCRLGMTLWHLPEQIFPFLSKFWAFCPNSTQYSILWLDIEILKPFILWLFHSRNEANSTKSHSRIRLECRWAFQAFLGKDAGVCYKPDSFPLARSIYQVPRILYDFNFVSGE